MRRFFIASLAICLSLAATVTAQAGALVFSRTFITNFVVTDAVTGLPIVVDDGMGTGDIVLLSNTFSSVNSANVGGFGVANFLVDSDFTGNTPNAAFLGGGVYSENDFSTVPAGVSNDYARGDNESLGAIADGLPIADPASNTTYADLGLDASSAASATSSLDNGASFAPLRDISAIVSFDYTVELDVTSDIAGSGTATSAFITGFNGTNPDGSILDVSFTPADLQNLLVGNGSISITDSFTSAPVDFGFLGTYGFTGSQSNGVSFNPIPEPATFASFALIGVCGIGMRRRRRR